MKLVYSVGLCAAAAIAFNMAVFAQATSQAQAPSTAAAQQTAGEQQVTITGCIQRESDYRRAREAGRGGVAGTGVGAANEFVLINASMGAASGAAGATGTTGTAGMAYELTGSNEGQAEKLVGQRVEIMGKLKAAEVAASGKPTGGATAGKPPEGIEVTGQDLKLRELEVGTVRQVPGTCPAK